MSSHAADHSTDTTGSSAGRADPSTGRTNPPIEPSTDPTGHPLATEFALAITVLVGFYLWQRAVPTVPSPMYDAVPFSGSLLVDGFVRSGLVLAGLCLLAGAYVSLRNIEVRTGFPSSDDLSLAGAALVLPVVLVGLTKVVGGLTGVLYGSLTLTAVAVDASVEPFLVVTGLGLFVGVPGFLLTCQVVLQGSFRNVVDGKAAAVLTTAVAGFLLTGGSGSPSPFPELGKLVGAVLFVLAVGVALSVPQRTSRRWLRFLAWAPAVVLVVISVFSGIAAVESVAGGLFVTTQIVVLGLAAYTYERTETLLVPALAYLSLTLTSSVVVFVFEAGMQSW